MKKLYFAIASLALLFIGCQDDETLRSMTEEVSSFNQITVTPDILADTRAYINDAKKMVWEQGDTIGVYSDTDEIVPFVYTSGNTFTAAKSVKGTKFYAYFPYSVYPFFMDTIKVEKDSLLLRLPTRNINPGPNNTIIKKDVVPMVGKSTNNQFVFKQVMGVLHFTVKDFAKVTGVTLSTNNNEIINGPSKIDMSADSPELKIYEIPDKRGTSDFRATVDKTLAEGEIVDIYIPVPVGTYAKGFTLVVSGSDKYDEALSKTMRTDKEVVVKRAGMNSYTEIEFTDADYLAAIESAMTNAYASFFNGVENQFTAGASWLNNIVFGDVAGADANEGSQAGDQPDFKAIGTFAISPNNSYIHKKWYGVYNAVWCAHRVMSMISHAPAGLVENPELLIAQAKFIKAVWLFEGIRMFGAAIPYVSPEDYQVNNKPNYDMPQTSNVDASGNYVYIWDKVEQDFKDAINGLPATWEAGNEGRATSWMAKAMLAKLYLYWSSPYNGTNGTADHWNDAKTLLDEIINSGKYSLVNKYSDLFNPNMAGDSSESVFDIEVSTTSYTKMMSRGGWGFYQPTYEFVNSFMVDTDGLPASNYTTLDPLTTIIHNPDGSIGTKTDFDTYVDPRLDFIAGRPDVPYWDMGIPGLHWVRQFTNGGPYVNKKFQAKPATYFYPTNRNEVRHYSVIRYADILLMRAECAIHDIDLNKAISLIDQVRARAANDYVVNNDRNKTMDDKVNGTQKNGAASNYRIGLYTTPFASAAEAHTALEREMRAEFGMEGHRWFDIARWGTAATVLNNYRTFEGQFFNDKYVNEYQAKWVTFPIPSGPINNSEGRIVQNENWK